MKRHLVYPLDFDTRAHFLEEPKDTCNERAQKLHRENQAKLIEQLKFELGENNFNTKLKNFKDTGISPFSIMSHHNNIYRQARYSFVYGLYYPSLTASCALGERILNHLIIDLRKYYTSSTHYKKIYRKKSFDDWDKAIEILSDWNIFHHDDVKTAFQELKTLRNNSIHFNQETYSSMREDALEALKKLQIIISIQFGIAQKQKWMIEGTRGDFFIKKEAENDPFLMEYYIPQCPKVSPYYTMSMTKNGQWLFFDWKNCKQKQITDQEFAQFHTDRTNDQLVPNSIPASKDVIIQTIIRT